MNKFKRFMWARYYSRVYSFVDEKLCCCGSDNCEWDMIHSFRSAKAYSVACVVERKLNKEK